MRRIQIVEDDPALAKVLSDNLKIDGFNVHSDGIHFYFGQYINDRVDPFLGNLASGPRFCLFLILEQKLFSFLKKVF